MDRLVSKTDAFNPYDIQVDTTLVAAVHYSDASMWRPYWYGEAATPNPSKSIEAGDLLTNNNHNSLNFQQIVQQFSLLQMSDMH